MIFHFRCFEKSQSVETIFPEDENFNAKIGKVVCIERHPSGAIHFVGVEFPTPISGRNFVTHTLDGNLTSNTGAWFYPENLKKV